MFINVIFKFYCYRDLNIAFQIVILSEYFYSKNF